MSDVILKAEAFPAAWDWIKQANDVMNRHGIGIGPGFAEGGVVALGLGWLAPGETSYSPEPFGYPKTAACTWPGCANPALCTSGNFGDQLVCGDHFAITNGPANTREAVDAFREACRQKRVAELGEAEPRMAAPLPDYVDPADPEADKKLGEAWKVFQERTDPIRPRKPYTPPTVTEIPGAAESLAGLKGAARALAAILAACPECHDHVNRLVGTLIGWGLSLADDGWRTAYDPPPPPTPPR